MTGLCKQIRQSLVFKLALCRNPLILLRDGRRTPASGSVGSPRSNSLSKMYRRPQTDTFGCRLVTSKMSYRSFRFF